LCAQLTRDLFAIAKFLVVIIIIEKAARTFNKKESETTGFAALSEQFITVNE